jgi:hypothetical protein
MTATQINKNVFTFFGCVALVISIAACTPVKPYQRAYLNDQAMGMGTPTLGKFNENAHSYREGASGGGRGKTSGGCGCN